MRRAPCALLHRFRLTAGNQLDWPISLIASHLDMPEGTIKSHLHRGRKRLRVLFKEQSTLAQRLEGVAR